jgi:NADH-quinone oxidoreductase subunit A
MTSYLPIAIFAALGCFFVVSVLVIARLASPSAPTPAKLETYECGPAPVGDAWGQFHVRYYLIALLFVIFDVEAAFLYPWAVARHGDQAFMWFAKVELLIFMGMLLVAWAWAWMRGAMEWE